MRQHILDYRPGIMLFIIALIIGVFCFKDYGVAWDESLQRGAGITTYRYIFNNDQSLKTIDDRDLGTGFELPLIFVEKLFGFKDSIDIYPMRHLVTYLFFMVGVLCGYILALRLFKSQFIACLAFIMLAFQPRIFAHAFYNSKDIPFLSAFLISFLLCNIAFEKNKPFWYLLLGFGCGYATSIRVMGVMLVPCISLFFLFDFARAVYFKNKLLPAACNFLCFLAAFCVLLYISWPILWSSPVHYFTEEFQKLAHVHWEGDVLFNGRDVKGSNLPWAYLPVWFCITMPELWLVFGLSGFLLALYLLITKPKKFLFNTPERNFVLYLLCFAGPVIVVIALNSINYDDWRHLYFIYPSFVMLALFAVSKIAVNRKKIIVQIACFVQVGLILFSMIRLHPFEGVYFNYLVSHKDEYLRYHYDMDYWDIAYKNSLEYILAHDNAPLIKVACPSGPMRDNVAILPEPMRKRIMIVGEHGEPDYFITNFRNHPEEYPYPHIFYGLKEMNSTISRVYKVH